VSATAVSELSMDPPLLLICVDRSAGLCAPLVAGLNFCVNILRADQRSVSLACGGDAEGEARFSEGQWGSGACGSPYLREAQANFFCEYETHFDFGSHAVVIGAVREADSWGEPDPLIYVDGDYAGVVRF
jgi:flavin reductase (DIM6/NTAB) family NADH-FMN oxidoreductase RutF